MTTSTTKTTARIGNHFRKWAEGGLDGIYGEFEKADLRHARSPRGISRRFDQYQIEVQFSESPLVCTLIGGLPDLLGPVDKVMQSNFCGGLSKEVEKDFRASSYRVATRWNCLRR